MKIEQSLDKIHSKVTKNKYLQLFTSFTRILLAIGFIPPSIPKIMYRRFTTIPDTHPVGHYFEALYQTGYYYQFIGLGQIVAAILLLIPRTSHIGAVMFFPIILNIMVLTNSVGFKGTWFITILMFTASLYLVCWDYDRWKSILFFKRPLTSSPLKYEFILLPVIFGAGGILGYLFLGYYLLQTFSTINMNFLLIIGIFGLLFGFFIAVHHKFMRVGNAVIDKDGFAQK